MVYFTVNIAYFCFVALSFSFFEVAVWGLASFKLIGSKNDRAETAFEILALLLTLGLFKRIS